MKKACTQCKKVKPLKDFHKKITGKFGRYANCKSCAREYGHAYRTTHKQVIKENYRAYCEANRESIYVQSKTWRQGHPEKMREYSNNYYIRFPERHKARQAVNNALRSGVLVRPNKCDCCSRIGKVEAHHKSYAKKNWLKVEWLLPDCHSFIHREAA